MRRIAPKALRQIAEDDDKWVEKARDLVKDLKDQDKERQLRNIQSIAEGSDSWKALKLFIRYQAARKELPRDWAEAAIQQLGDLRDEAQSLAEKYGGDTKALHMEIVSRVLGYAVRWHVWDVR